MQYLEFESKIKVLESKIDELSSSRDRNLGLDFEKEILSLKDKLDDLLESTYDNLSPWQKVAVARHQGRPHTLDYIEGLIENFIPLKGDRLFGEDEAITGGIGRFLKQTVMVIGIEKGHDLESNLKHNFGMPKPEGYRKAQRLMLLAEHMRIPIITFIDTAGAYPGQEAEERGQGEAIAKSIAVCLEITTPLVVVIIGEGGSGGALAMAAGDYVIMLEHAIYSVISPEGCASILWRDDKMAEEAAKSLCLTAQDLLKFKIIDKIVKEPIGGSHRNKALSIKNVSDAIESILIFLQQLNPLDRKKRKEQRYLAIGKILK
ncbi:Acetyl-coenzyme A carboxylase carboxyl transferase subunit alpha [Candidatus Hepatincolaceae symbiont of Richtersius coronifer]